MAFGKLTLALLTAAMLTGTAHAGGSGGAQRLPAAMSGPVSAGFADLVETVAPAVLSVRVHTSGTQKTALPSLPRLPEDHPLKEFFRDFPQPDITPRERPTAQGSGFFVSPDGYVVTNHHVIEKGSSVTVVLHDGKELDARVVGSDERTDLALLKVEGEGFPSVQFADAEATRVGDWVVAVGNPFGLGGTVTAGIVSGRGRDIGAGPYDDFIQIDAAVNRGNSGGPAFDLDGKVVGVNTAIFSPSGGNVGIAFAIPSSTVVRVVESLIERGAVERGWLGVQIQSVTQNIAESLGMPASGGALVISGTDGSPAIASGVRPGDVVVAVDGSPIKTPRELSMQVGWMTPGREVKLSVWRNGTVLDVPVVLGTMPVTTTANADMPENTVMKMLAGFGFEAATDEGRLVVTKVDPEGIAAVAGLVSGDVIASVNTLPVTGAQEFAAAVSEAKEAGRKAVLLGVERQGGSAFVAVPMP